MLLEDQQEINDALEGRKFLERHSLLCPPGEPPTHTSLSTCLHQVSMMAGVQKPVLNAIRSIAFLLEELEETQINGTVKEAFDSQITEFTSDMKMLIEDAREKIDEHLKVSEEKIAQAMANAATQANRNQTNTFASVLVTPPPHANPKIAAKEGIKARQFLLEGIKESKFSRYDIHQLKVELNKILQELGLEKGKIRSVNNLRNGGSLIELDSDEATTWFLNQENRTKVCGKIGPTVVCRTRLYSLIAFNVPLDINPDDHAHRQEVNEANNLDQEIITAMRWAKPPNRRSPAQRTAHLILTFNNADAANRSITDGLYICNRRCHVERVKREPTRCLKCQGWNHFAKECLEREDKCGNCTKNHRTSECPTPTTTSCVSCKLDDHASWSRSCPTFLKKLREMNERNPENALQYIPTADPWTWTANTNLPAPKLNPPARTNANWERNQSTRNAQAPARKYDSYVPNYDRNGQRSTENRPHILDWNDPQGPANLRTFQPLSQQTMNSIDREATDRPDNTTNIPK